jgi:hypothetical protein
LSLAIGIPVEELKDRLTAKECQSWKRYKMVVGPFPHERADYNTALIVRTLYELQNIIITIVCKNSDVPKSPKLEECLVKYERLATELNTEEVANQEVERVKAFLAKWKNL